MASKALLAEINPEVLRYFRQDAGWTVSEIASKLGLTESEISQWEKGEEAISFTQLERYAKCVKRPVAAFFLPEPPPATAVPTDFRMLPAAKKEFSKHTRLALRRAIRLQRISSQMLNGHRPSSGHVAVSITDDPEKTAIRERNKFGPDIQSQVEWKNPGQALRSWREAFERSLILVFQMKLPIADARGFSLAEDFPPVIVISSEDSINARIFTLAHEYGHLLLKRSGICIPGVEFARSDQKAKVERWSDSFAGAFLVPESLFRTDVETQDILGMPITDRSVSRLANRLKVSREVILRRLRTLELITKQKYIELYGKLQRKRAQTDRGSGFREHPAKTCVTEKGKLLPSLVLQQLHNNAISTMEAANYLSLAVKHFERLESLVS